MCVCVCVIISVPGCTFWNCCCWSKQMLKLDSSIEYVGFLLAISMYECNMNDTVAVGVAGEHPGGGWPHPGVAAAEADVQAGRQHLHQTGRQHHWVLAGLQVLHHHQAEEPPLPPWDCCQGKVLPVTFLKPHRGHSKDLLKPVGLICTFL